MEWVSWGRGIDEVFYFECSGVRGDFSKLVGRGKNKACEARVDSASEKQPRPFAKSAKGGPTKTVSDTFICRPLALVRWSRILVANLRLLSFELVMK